MELESIRKRVPAGSEVQERIDRLEASHRNILRKLEEVFPPAGAEPSPGLPAPKSASLEGLLRTLGRAGDGASFALRAAASVLEIEPPLSSAPGGSLTEAATDQCQLPSLDERCGRCGRVLLTSLLGGEEVLCFDGEWVHRACAPETEAGEPFGKPGTLN